MLQLFFPLIALASPLFEQPSVLALSLEADFAKIHAANEGGNWENEDRSDPKFWSMAKLVDLSHPSRVFLLDIRARGMSSALPGEATFPKLRVEIRKSEERKGTAFQGARQFRINTHVSTHPTGSHTGMGRWNGEESPYREALAYELARGTGLNTPAFRRASITYSQLGGRNLPAKLCFSKRIKMPPNAWASLGLPLKLSPLTRPHKWILRLPPTSIFSKP